MSESGEALDATSERWRALLLGTDPGLRRLRRRWQHIPSAPRCKVCSAPFRGPGRIMTSVLMHGRSDTNPMLCNACFGTLRKQQGGAQVPLSVLFADVRGSTGLAERMDPSAYTRLLHRFYEVAALAIEDEDGVLDKFLGDGVMALFLPVFAGDGHAGRAISAARHLLAVADRRDLSAAGLRVGAGVHTGEAFVGVLGAAEHLDFSALGDTVNVAARLGSLASQGELLASASTWAASGFEPPVGEVRRIEIAGRSEPLDVVAELVAASLG